MNRTIISARYLIIPLAVALALTSSCSRGVKTVEDLGTPELNAGNFGIIDYSWTVESLDGDTVPLETFRGRVMFINIWATWCPPCVVEMPTIQTLYDETAGDGVVFLLLSPEEPAVIHTFMDSRGYSFPVHIIRTELPVAMQDRALPRSYLVSKEGVIIIRHEGEADWATPEVTGFVRELVSR